MYIQLFDALKVFNTLKWTRHSLWIGFEKAHINLIQWFIQVDFLWISIAIDQVITQAIQVHVGPAAT